MTAIEASLGLESEDKGKLRPKPDPLLGSVRRLPAGKSNNCGWAAFPLERPLGQHGRRSHFPI
jgi:hypothetical protein